MTTSPPPRALTSVLFMCVQNAVRSPMAAALLRRRLGHRIFVRSAGVEHGETDGFAMEVMDEIGVDLHAHHPQAFVELADTSFDLVVALAPEAHAFAREKLRAQAVDIEFWDVPEPDPRGQRREQRLDSYRAIRDDLARRVADRFPL
jgi:protein-tyrosine-phosphatase